MQQEVVLCAASAYEKKFYINPMFDGIPQSVKDELKIMCVLFTEDVGGILELVYNEDGELEFRTSFDEGDYLYDEIGSGQNRNYWIRFSCFIRLSWNKECERQYLADVTE